MMSKMAFFLKLLWIYGSMLSKICLSKLTSQNYCKLLLKLKLTKISFHFSNLS
jgi:hypothetical protein